MKKTSNHRAVTVDLARFSQAGARVFAGHRWGRYTRRQAGLAGYDRDPETVVMIRIPMDIISLDTSFVRGMFGPSIRKLKGEFSSKYQLVGDQDQVEYINMSLEADVADLLRPTYPRFGSLQDSAKTTSLHGPSLLLES